MLTARHSVVLLKNRNLMTTLYGVLEIVIDGLSLEAVGKAMRVGMAAAAKPGIKQISAENYGGDLDQYHIYLHKWGGAE